MADYIPEFSQHIKETITIRHLLTHTAGFRTESGVDFYKDLWHQIIDQICASPLEQERTPGKKTGYHFIWSWFILGEIAQHINGHPLSQIVPEDICLPMNMQHTYLGMTTTQIDTYDDRIGHMHNAPEPHNYLDTQEGATLCRPGGGGKGPICELGKY